MVSKDYVISTKPHSQCISNNFPDGIVKCFANQDDCIQLCFSQSIKDKLELLGFQQFTWMFDQTDFARSQSSKIGRLHINISEIFQTKL